MAFGAGRTEHCLVYTKSRLERCDQEDVKRTRLHLGGYDMKAGSLADFLIRAVVDDAFRELALIDPQRAFEGYDLGDEQKDILSCRDGRLLGLLGEAIGKNVAPAERAPEVEQGESNVPTGQSQSAVKLLLRLTPQVVQSPDSEPKVSYAASLQAWPDDEERGQDPDVDDQSETHAGDAAQELRWVISIVPTVVGQVEAGLQIAYSASIDCQVARRDQAIPPMPDAAQKLASPPWNHHVESSAAKAAAQAVRMADPDKRYAKLLELVHALQTGDIGG